MYRMLYADVDGRMYEHRDFQAVGRSGNIFAELDDGDTIPLPEGAGLVLIPSGTPVGINKRGDFAVVDRDRAGGQILAVGALLPQGYTRTMVPAFRRSQKEPLPLFGYAAVAWKDGSVYVAARQTDEDVKWNPSNYCTEDLRKLIEKTVAEFPGNRIIAQLSRCAAEYSCFTAQNIFYRRWEGGIPVSPACNAACLGCISLQPAECCPSPQTRINFSPTPQEVFEVALPHLLHAEDGIISFGQGCEGEPSLAAKTISSAIVRLRRETDSGTINMNTNAGYTEGIKAICTAGIDSLRVSTISARESTYNVYYNPDRYSWDDVCQSVAFARDRKVFISLNLLTYPGLTDSVEETEALVKFIQKYEINMVQIRNLNIDPDYLAARIPMNNNELLGINGFVETLKAEVPGLEIGNYSRPVVR